MKKAKFKRSNVDRRKSAEKLIRVWYTDLTAEGATTYRRGGQKASTTLAEHSERDTLAQARKDRPQNFKSRRVRDATGQLITAPMSADGKERRYIFVDEDEHDFPAYRDDDFEPPPAGVGLGRRPTEPPEGRPYELYAREAMRHVAKICREAHRVLEMTAAGWPFEEIAEEIGCGEPTARQLHEEGMGVVMSYQVLVKPAHVHG